MTTTVFVHGVPETTAVWDPLVAALGLDDAVQLALPGFGCPLPSGFTPDMGTYAAWLAEQLAAFDEVDVVSHDWGGLLALRVVSDRPTNVRSWITDSGDLDESFQWHDTARIWQTPGDGEALMDGMVGASNEDRAALLEGVGVPPAASAGMAATFDRRMADAILTLYRSATSIGTDWGPGLDRIEAPGLLVASAHDPFRTPDRVQRLAERTGARVLELPDSGHFWMLDDPATVAPALTEFWSSLG